MTRLRSKGCVKGWRAMLARIENAPPGQAEGRSEQQLAMPFSNLTDLTTWKPTPEPTPATCAICGADRNVYQLGDGQWVCVEHIGLVVSLAANDVFSGDVSYSKAFEAEVLL